MPDVTLRLTVVETRSDWLLVRCQSQHGNASTHVANPFAGDDFGKTLHDLELALIRSSSKEVTRRAAPPERTAADFGQRLSDVLMAGRAGVIFDRCVIKAREDRAAVRIILETDGATVSRIPWEFALDPQSSDFLALRLSLSRALHVAEPMPPLAVDLPLRVLGIHALPHDAPQLDFEQERRKIADAFAGLSPDLVDVTWLPGDRWRDVSSALQDGPWHVLHFIGHGGFNHEIGAGYIELSENDGSAKQVYGSDLARAMSGSRNLRLVVLNACESATSGTGDVFASTAARVMKERVPAVIAMQYEITDSAALEFSAAFYEAIALGVPVDVAVTRARETTKVNLGSLEWATPVLFLASDETRLFDVAIQPAHVDANPTPRAAAVESTPGEPMPVPVAPPPAKPASVRPIPLQQISHTDALGPTSAMAVGPRDLVALAGPDGQLCVWSTRSNRMMARCQLPSGAEPWQVAWSPWPRHVATANDDRTVVVWDLETEIPLRILRPGVQRIQSLAFSTDGQWLAVAGIDRSIHLYDAQGREVQTVTLGGDAAPHWFGPVAGLGPLLFAPGDRHVVVATNDGALSKVDARGDIVGSWPHARKITSVAFNTSELATCTEDERLRIWDWDGKLMARGDDNLRAQQVAVGSGVAVITSDGRVVLLSSTGQAQGEGRTAGRPVGVGFGASGPITVTADGILQQWSRGAGTTTTP